MCLRACLSLELLRFRGLDVEGLGEEEDVDALVVGHAVVVLICLASVRCCNHLPPLSVSVISQGLIGFRVWWAGLR
jgi:hypothetical protein